MSVPLRPVDKANWRGCAALQVTPEQQGNVASNVATIAQSKFEPHYHLRAIYPAAEKGPDETPVGMLAFCHEDDPVDLTLFWLFRLLIDHRYQRRGYGEAAMRLAIEEIWALGATPLRTMHKPSNSGAAALYAKLGFTPTGELMDDGDVVLEIRRP